MPFNGSGVYNPIGSPDFPAVAATTIRAAQYNNEINDIASALTNCVTRDGQSAATADLPMGGNKHTNVAAAALRTQYARVAEVQDGALTTLNTVAGVDTITAAAPLNLTAYTTGQTFSFVSAGANTGPVTLNINALGAKAVTKLGATALAAGDIPSGAVVKVFYDGIRFQLVNLAANSALTATSGPDASQIAWRNKIINGGGLVQQRGPMALSATANTSFCCDQITVQAAGGTGLSGNANVATRPSRSGYCFGAVSCNWTSATMKVQTRIIAAATIPLNSRTITVSGKVYHNIGSTRTCQIVIQKANAVNNFSGVTTLGTSSTFSAPSDSATAFSYTLTLGASDGNNGLLISVEDTAASTATAKTFTVEDFQLEEGSKDTPFEVRPFEVELQMCQAYYEKSFPIGTAPAQNTGSSLGALTATGQVANQRFGAFVAYKTPKWTRPGLITLYSPNAASGNWSTNVTTPTAVVVNDGDSGFYVAGTTNVTAGADYAIHWTSEAKL